MCKCITYIYIYTHTYTYTYTCVCIYIERERDVWWIRLSTAPGRGTRRAGGMSVRSETSECREACSFRNVRVSRNTMLGLRSWKPFGAHDILKRHLPAMIEYDMVAWTEHPLSNWLFRHRELCEIVVILQADSQRLSWPDVRLNISYQAEVTDSPSSLSLSSLLAVRSRLGTRVERDRPSEGGMIRLQTLIELKLLNSSFSSLSSYWNQTNKLPVELFEATASQSTVPSPPHSPEACGPEILKLILLLIPLIWTILIEIIVTINPRGGRRPATEPEEPGDHQLMYYYYHYYYYYQYYHWY